MDSRSILRCGNCGGYSNYTVVDVALMPKGETFADGVDVELTYVCHTCQQTRVAVCEMAYVSAEEQKALREQDLGQVWDEVERILRDGRKQDDDHGGQI